MTSDEHKSYRPLILVLSVIVFGLVLSWSATREVIVASEREAQAEFDAQAGLILERLSTTFRLHLEVTDNISTVFDTFGSFTTESFRKYVSQDAALRRATSAVLTTVYVPATIRKPFLEDTELNGGANYTMWRLTGNVGDADDVLLNHFMWSSDDEWSDKMSGLDLSTIPELGTILTQSMNLQQDAVIPLNKELSKLFRLECGLMIIKPYKIKTRLQNYALGKSADEIIGHTIRVAESPTLLAEALGGLNRADYALTLRQEDIDKEFTYVGGVGIQSDKSVLANYFTKADWFQVGGSRWDVDIHINQSMFKIDYGRAVITAFVCLILTGLVSYIVWSQYERSLRIVKIVDRRTRALREAHDELEEHYKLLQALNQDLDDARRSAEAANSAKSEFLATMSHELRTPLNAILGFSQILQDQALGTIGDPRYADYAKDIHNSGSHLLRLINDILDLAKLEADKIVFEYDPVSAKFLTDRVTTILSGQAEAKGLQLVTNIDPDMPDHFEGDELRLRQILINLISNAIKFTEVGSVETSISVRNFLSGKPGYMIEVTDTGIGIPQAKQAALFERFSQVDGAHSREHGGAGLGLAICRELAERMGGSIGVKSKPGYGTTFWVHLPLIVTESDSELEEESMI